MVAGEMEMGGRSHEAHYGGDFQINLWGNEAHFRNRSPIFSLDF